MNIREIEQSVDKASALLRALANERRLMILCQLVENEKSVGMLVEQLGIAQAMISQQLAILKKEGLVRARRDGQSIYYVLDNEPAVKILQVLHEAYCAPEREIEIQ